MSTEQVPNPLFFNRRRLFGLGAGLAGGAVLAACGGTARDATRETSATAKLTAAAPAPTAATSGTVGTAGSASTSAVAAELEGDVTIWGREGDLFKVFDDALKGFTSKHPKVRLKHQAVDIDAKLATSLVSGTNVPDGSFWEDTNIQGSAGNLTDLTDVLKPYTADLIQYKLDVLTVGGRTVGVPWDLDPGLLFYRADLCEQAGVDPEKIETYDDLLAAARTVKAKLPNTKPIRLEGDEYLVQLQLEMFANQLDTGMVDAQGTLRIDSDAYRQILTWQRTAVSEGLATTEKLHSPSDISNCDGDINVFVPFAIWWDYAPQMLYKKTKGKWRAMKLPAWTSGGARSGIMGGSSFVIPAKAKRPDLAFAVFEYLALSKEGATKVYGPSSVYPTGLNTSLPSYKPALDPKEPLFKPVAALGNQDVWAVASAAADEVLPGYRLTPWFGQAVKYLGAGALNAVRGKITVDDCLTQASSQIQKNLIDRR